MKYALSLVMIISLLISATSAFAEAKGLFQEMSDNITQIGKPSGAGAAGVSKGSVFQKVAGDVEGIGKKGSVPAKYTVLQKVKDNIDTWDDSQDQVKTLSLRDNKAELAKRRGLK
ncbi:MAG: hypothetical protein HQ549_06485 [Candidatus Omnitrophica bacterium]|nr:hypothetical protein [Candidatus Omnitrophota bacterium]